MWCMEGSQAVNHEVNFAGGLKCGIKLVNR